METSLFQIRQRESFGFSAENPTGTREGGTHAKDCEKLRPCIDIEPGETVVLCDTDGPGMITHIWFTGYVGHSFVMRIYWDNEEFPSVEAPISAFFGCAYDENFKDRDGKYVVLNAATMLTAPGRGYNSYWEMPFYKHCKITMENRGEQKQTLFYMISGWHGEIPEDSGLQTGASGAERTFLYCAGQRGGSRNVCRCMFFLRYEWQQHLLGRRRDQDVY